jgi:hypothetical protein
MLHPYHVVEIILLVFYHKAFYLSFERFKKHCTSLSTSGLVRIHMAE